MSKQAEEVTGRLENWRVQFHPDIPEFIIWGCIFDDIHGRFKDGTYIHTSGIEVVMVKEGDIVVTRNSTYLLGKKRAPPVISEYSLNEDKPEVDDERDWEMS